MALDAGILLMLVLVWMPEDKPSDNLLVIYISLLQ